MSRKFDEMNYNEDVMFYALIENMQKRYTANRASYYGLTLSDGVSSADARVWNCSIIEENDVQAGNIYLFDARVNKYGETKQFVLNRIQEVPEGAINKSDFIKCAPVEKNVIIDGIKEYIKKINNTLIHDLVVTIYNKINKEFFEYPAAMSMHHNYLYGLGYHTYTMAKLADKVLEIYPGMNSDVLYAGVLLHDIGKVKELSGSVSPVYTEDGNLLGHIVIGLQMLSVAASELDMLETEEYKVLSHLVASHHGELEFGSPKEPCMMEAYALHLIDLMDSRLASMSPEVVRTEKGTSTAPIGSINRKSLYVPKL